MTANLWDFYNVFTEYIGDGTIDLDNDSFKMALFLSTSNCATLTLDAYASFSNEVAQAYGYTTAGNALSGVAWTRSAGSTKFTCDAEVWTASGGSLVCRFAMIYDDTVSSPTADPPVCYSLLDNAPADVTVTDGNTLTITPHASGIFTLAT